MTDGENSNSMQRILKICQKSITLTPYGSVHFQKDSMMPGCSVATSLLAVIH